MTDHIYVFYVFPQHHADRCKPTIEKRSGQPANTTWGFENRNRHTTSIKPMKALAAEPVVFERNGRVYANTRDVAGYYRQNHRKMVQGVERVLEVYPDLVSSGDAIEVFYRDDRGRPAVSYNISISFFRRFALYLAGLSHADASPYQSAFDNKEKEVRAAIATVPQTLEEVLCMAADTDDPETLHVLVMPVTGYALSEKKEEDMFDCIPF